jgi:hypothetical protein
MLDRVDASDQILAAIAALTDEVRALRIDLVNITKSIPAADELSVAAAARLVGRSEQCVRDWCTSAGIGRYDASVRRHWVSRTKLRDYVFRRFGLTVPGPVSLAIC